MYSMIPQLFVTLFFLMYIALLVAIVWRAVAPLWGHWPLEGILRRKRAADGQSKADKNRVIRLDSTVNRRKAS